jgi:hypothetical protein
MSLRSTAYATLRYANDARAVRRGKVAKRVARRVYGRATGRLARRLFR